MTHEGNKYCVIFMGDVEGMQAEIERISFSKKIGFASSKNVTISTFKSIFDVEELGHYFRKFSKDYPNFNFFIMEIERSEIFFSSKEITDKLMSIFGDVDTTEKILPEPVVDEELDISEMSPSAKQDMINNLLDRINQLTEKEIGLLKKLSE